MISTRRLNYQFPKVVEPFKFNRGLAPKLTFLHHVFQQELFLHTF